MASGTNRERNLFALLKQTVSDIYNHLGYSMLVSVIWFFVTVPFFVIILNILLGSLEAQDHPLALLLFLLVIGVPYTALILGPVHTALFYQMNQVINNQAEFKGLWEGLRQHYWLAVRVYALFTGLLQFCLVDLIICFYVLDRFSLKIFGFVLFYLFLFFLISTLYLPGFIVLQNNTFKKVLKKTLILCLDNPLLTIGAFLILIVVGVVATLITPLLLLFYGSCLQVMMLHLFNGVMAKYPDPVATVPEGEAL